MSECTVKKTSSAFLAIFLAGFASAAISATNLVKVPAFEIGIAGSPLGAYPTVIAWSNTGNKTVGYDTVDMNANSLWLSQTRSVSTGSKSNVGWAAAKTGYLTPKLPTTGCDNQTVQGSLIFHGADVAKSGLQISFGTSVNNVMWSTPGVAQVFSFNTKQQTGVSYYVYLQTQKGLMQLNGVRSGIEVLDLKVICS